MFSILFLLSGCAVRNVDMQQIDYVGPAEEQEEEMPVAGQPASTAAPAKPTVKKDLAVVRRKITEQEVRKLQAKDPELDFYKCVEILSRLNKKDKEYIRADMKHKRAMQVPRDFSAYKNWTPLPRTLMGAGKFPKCILVVKDIPFLGWYERGKLVGDTYVCIGKMRTWTKRGMYRVKEKDPNHMSNYPNAYGEPSLMPMAMRVYDRVWIHTGDVIGANCSHGCINVPIAYADKLYAWTEIGTVVVITESLKDLGRQMEAGFQEQPQQNQNPPANKQKPAPKTEKKAPPAQPVRTDQKGGIQNTNI